MEDTRTDQGTEADPLSPHESHSQLPHGLVDYELLQEIARGGMGVVYRARQRSLNRTVAVKMVLFGPFTDRKFIERFRVEAEVAASLKHSNIVALHEIGELDGQPWFSMDYIEGRSLAECMEDFGLTVAAGKNVPSGSTTSARKFRTDRGRAAAARAARLLISLCGAVHYAHQRGVIHRDLKPSNILIDLEGRAHLTDFGLARRVQGDSSLTLTGQVLGTPHYMPPEQAAGAHDQVGVRSDVYSLGAILYHLLTGRPVFSGKTLSEVCRAAQEDEPVRPHLLNPDIPFDLETICLKCLEKEPDKRYGSADALAGDLQRWLNNDPIQARPATAVTRLHKWARRKPAVAGLVSALLAIFVLGIGGVIWQWRRAVSGELHAYQSVYASQMKRAQLLFDANNAGDALKLLNEMRPRSGQKDLRGWEWRYLWQCCKSDALFSLCQRSNSIWSLSISHDGKWLAVGEWENGGFSIWNLQTRKEHARLPAGDSKVHVAFSPAEPILAYSRVSGPSTNRESGIRLWDLTTERQIAALPLGAGCAGLAFSGDGHTLVTCTAAPEGKITLWRVSDGSKLSSYSAKQNAVDEAIPFAVTQDLATAAYGTTNIHFVDLATGVEHVTARAADDNIMALTFSPDGKSLASSAGYSESSIRLWDTASGSETRAPLEGHGGWVGGMAFWPDGQTLASASADGTIRVWEFGKTGNRSRSVVLRGHTNEVWRLALMPGNGMLVSGCMDGSVLVWDTANLASKPSRTELPMLVGDWCFSADSRAVLTTDAEGRVARWTGADFHEMDLLMTVATNFQSFRTRFSQDGDLLAVASVDGLIEVWDLPRRALRWRFRSPPSMIPEEFLAGGKRLVLGLGEWNTDRLHEWDLATGREIRSWKCAFAIPGQQRVVRFSRDHRWCLTLGYGGTSSLYDLTAGREIDLHLDVKHANSSAFSQDGKIFGAVTDRGIKLWDTTTFRELGAFGDFGFSLAFSSDGKRLAVGSGPSRTVTLWDLENQQELVTLGEARQLIWQTKFSADGNVLGCLDSRDQLQLFRAPTWAEIDASEKHQAVAQ